MSRWLSPDELVLRNVLARKVDLGCAMAVMPVRQVDIGNRVLEATHELLEERGFLVTAIHGGSDNAMKAACSLIAAARSEASKRNNIRPIVLIVKDAHLLPPGLLYLLAEVGDVAVVAAPAVKAARPQRMVSRRFAKIASMLVGSVLAALAAGAFLLREAQRSALEDRAARLFASTVIDLAGPRDRNSSAETAPATESMESIGAPGLLIRAKPGDTLEALYLHIYRNVTPPSFAGVVALNPETIRPGDILTFPAPVNGWSGQR